MPLDEGGEGPRLLGRNVAAEPQAAAGGVDPTGLPRPEGAGLAAAAAGLPGSLRAVWRDGRAQSEPLRGAGGTEHGLRAAGEAGARQRREQQQQQRREQQRRELAAAQRAPQATHAAERGPGESSSAAWGAGGTSHTFGLPGPFIQCFARVLIFNPELTII